MRKEREDGKFPSRKTRTSRFEETTRSFDVRRSEAEGPLSGGQGNLVSLILLSGPREAIHESGMRENRTFRLSGGRRRALQWAPPPTRHLRHRGTGLAGTREREGRRHEERTIGLKQGRGLWTLQTCQRNDNG